MNKKITLTLIFTLIFSFTFSQSWLKFLPENTKKENLTLKDYQKAFNQYWDEYNVDKAWYTDENGNKQKALGWKQFKRWEHFWEPRVHPISGKFPELLPAQVFNNYISENGKYPINKSCNWTNLGTNSSTGGYAGIGRINVIAFHPTDDNTFWIGAPSGGLWQTTDGGSNWTVLTDNNDVLGVSSIIIPSDYASSNTIYIGTGDRDHFDDHSVGVLKSTDGGSTWNTTGLSFDLSNSQCVNKMLLDPDDDQKIYAATTEGFYITTDGAENWDKYDVTNFVDIEFCPNDKNIIYGVTFSGQFFKSTDGGQNWTMNFSTGAGARLEMAVTADNANIVYIVAANSNNGLHGIYKSTDKGNNFNLVFNDYNLLGWSETGNDSGGQGWYDLSLAADPNNENIVYCGGVNTWMSDDGGSTWQLNNHWYGGGGVQAVHADKHYLEYRHNTSTLFECNDGGVYITTDGVNWTDLTNGMVISQIYRLGVAQSTSSETINGLQDNGTKVQAEDQWYDVIGGDGMECLIDYTDKNVQYGSLYYGDIRRTTNHWNSSMSISENIPGGANGNWITPYIIHPTDPNTLFIGFDKLWKTTDQGYTFDKIGSFGSKLDNLAICQTDPDYIYAGTHSFIKKTDDGGENWTDITSGLPISSSNIRYITVKHNDPNTIWVALSGYNNNGVYESNNGGNTWNNISDGLPEIPVNCVIQNKLESSQKQLYAATDYGVYLKNGNNDWTLYSTNLPNVEVSELEIYYDMDNPENSRLRASTYGRGLWESPLDLSGNYAPLVSSQEATDLTATSAVLNGNISNDFGCNVTESGFVYSTDPNPIIGGANVNQVQTTPTVTMDDFSVEADGLESATFYYFKAYAINDNGTGYGNEKSFATECLSITDFPYTEDFEGASDFPICWSQQYVSGDNLDWIKYEGNTGNTIQNAHSGEFNMLFEDSDTQNDKTRLISPIFDLSSLDYANLSFWLASPKLFYYQDELKIYYKNSENGSWNLLKSYSEDLTSWTEKSLNLHNISDYYQIAFEGNALNGRGICIDDITIESSNRNASVDNNKISVFPNPTNGIINIINNYNSEQITLNIIDIKGEILLTKKLIKNNNKIDISEFDEGIYIIKIKTESNIIINKIIHQK